MSTSRTFSKIDPVAYRCGFNDWFDSEVTEERYIEDEEGKVFIL